MFVQRSDFLSANPKLCAAMRKPAPMPHDERVLIGVAGMSDQASAVLVQRALSGVPGMAELRCDAASESVWVRFYPEQVSAERLLPVISEAGFEARLIRLRQLALQS